MRKKLLIFLAILIGIYVVGTYIYLSLEPAFKDYCPIYLPHKKPISLEDPAFPSHHFKLINDASCLNETRIYDIITVKTTDDILQALKTAQEKKLFIAIAGVRHSMGGQAFFQDALVVDMRSFNKIIALDEKNRILTIQSGATWHDIQLYLHEKNLAVKAMQSTDIFTVGGSLSVNAHGMDHTVGSMGSTIRSFTIMLSDGSLQKVTPQEAELFNAVIGGYGLFGIVIEIELEVTHNDVYKRDATFLDYREFPAFFEREKDSYNLLYAHLSTSPLSFFKNVVIYGYKKVESDAPIEPLRKISLIKARRFLINLSKRRMYAQIFKWIAEKYIDPLLEKFHQGTLISRNAIMHDSVEYLENVLINETDILHEYFIPRKHFIPCIERMGAILQKSNIPVLNASIRVINKEDNLLNYAPEDMFAIVLYLNQRVNEKALHAMELLTRELIDLVLTFDGTFFLPYQLYFTDEQLHKAYPMIDLFFATKRKYDPSLLFMNNFYAKYAQQMTE